jgi:hypothetical protein
MCNLLIYLAARQARNYVTVNKLYESELKISLEVLSKQQRTLRDSIVWTARQSPLANRPPEPSRLSAGPIRVGLGRIFSLDAHTFRPPRQSDQIVPLASDYAGIRSSRSFIVKRSDSFVTGIANQCKLIYTRHGTQSPSIMFLTVKILILNCRNSYGS